MKRVSFPVLFGLVCLLAACGGGDKELLITDFATEFATSFCAKMYTCCTTTELDDIRGENFTDQASCATYFSGLLETYLLTPMQNAVADARGTYDAKQAARCLDTYADRGCVGATENDPTKLGEACEDFYVGLGGDTAVCRNNLECASGLMCVKAQGAAEGTCQALLAQGAACTPGEQPTCALTLYCDGQNCQTRKAAGAGCTADSECQVGLECVTDTNLCTATATDVCDGQ